MRRLMLGVVMALSVPAFAAPALAQYGGAPDYDQDDGYGKPDADDQDDYDRGGKYQDEVAPLPEPQAGDDGEYRGETWRDSEGQLRCRRSDGTVGLIVGGAAGALVGRGIDTRGERGTGTIIGGAVGALIGRAVERSARCQ